MVLVADVWCILFWVQLIAFVGIIICLVCWYDSELNEAEKRRIKLLQKKNQELRLAYIRIRQLKKSKKKQ